MDWTAAVDAYCERLGPAFWAEPVNAMTNAAFLVAAVMVWPGARGVERVLAVILFAIGVGSFLFHTVAQAWAGMADVAPILLFILVYVYAANRHFWGWPAWASALGAAAFVPYAAALARVFGHVPWLGSSAGYAPVPVLIYAYVFALRRRAPGTARGLAIGATILVVSLAARTLDEPLCGAIPVGTHFLWHVLNAVMLGWMIVVLRRHRLAGGAAGR